MSMRVHARARVQKVREVDRTLKLACAFGGGKEKAL